MAFKVHPRWAAHCPVLLTPWSGPQLPSYSSQGGCGLSSSASGESRSTGDLVLRSPPYSHSLSNMQAMLLPPCLFLLSLLMPTWLTLPLPVASTERSPQEAFADLCLLFNPTWYICLVFCARRKVPGGQAGLSPAHSPALRARPGAAASKGPSSDYPGKRSGSSLLGLFGHIHRLRWPARDAVNSHERSFQIGCGLAEVTEFSKLPSKILG